MYNCLKSTQLKVSWETIFLININFQDFNDGNSFSSVRGIIHFRAKSSLNRLTVNIAFFRGIWMQSHSGTPYLVSYGLRLLSNSKISEYHSNKDLLCRLMPNHSFMYLNTTMFEWWKQLWLSQTVWKIKVILLLAYKTMFHILTQTLHGL